MLCVFLEVVILLHTDEERRDLHGQVRRWNPTIIS